MRDVHQLLQRQAQWQKSRQALPWPEKIRLVEGIRDSIEAFRAERERRRLSGRSARENGIPRPKP